jgi:hypothetical protein
MCEKDYLILLNYGTILGFIYIEVYLAKKERKKDKLLLENQLESSRT